MASFALNLNEVRLPPSFAIPNSVLFKFFTSILFSSRPQHASVCCISPYLIYRLTLAKCNLLDQLQQWKCSADPKKPFIVASRYKGEYVWAANDFITGEKLIIQEIKPTKPINGRVDRASSSETYTRVPFPLGSNRKLKKLAFAASLLNVQQQTRRCNCEAFAVCACVVDRWASGSWTQRSSKNPSLSPV